MWSGFPFVVAVDRAVARCRELTGRWLSLAVASSVTLHEDARCLAEDWDEWAARAEPLVLTPLAHAPQRGRTPRHKRASVSRRSSVGLTGSDDDSADGQHRLGKVSWTGAENTVRGDGGAGE